MANLPAYAIPTATRDDPAKAAAMAIGAAFPATDLLVYPVYQESRVEYWAHRQTTAWVPLKVYAAPGESILGHLARRLAEQRASGGRTWMLVSPDGSPPLDPFLFERVGVDFDASDLKRIKWGERREVSGRIFREVIAIDLD